MARPRSARRGTLAWGLGVLLLLGCNALDDDSLGELVPSMVGRPGPTAGVAGGVAGGIAPGLGLPPASTSGGTGGGGVDASTPVPTVDAGVLPLLPECTPTPPGCGELAAHPIETEQPCVLALSDLRVDATRFCRGRVTLGAQTLGCGNPDGWTVTADGTLLVLLGGACALYASAQASLSVVFPCDAACRPSTPSVRDAATPDMEDAGVE